MSISSPSSESEWICSFSNRTSIPRSFKFIQARKKVAAYARVSRDTERLMHSVSAQVSYYSALIQKNPEWEYAGVYADMGISGTILLIFRMKSTPLRYYTSL